MSLDRPPPVLPSPHRGSRSILSEELQIRIHGEASLPTLVYLPGLHGDWTLVSSFRAAVAGRVRFVEFSYPRTVVWSLEDYALAIESTLLAHGIERAWLLGESFGSQPAWQLIARSLRTGSPPSALRNPKSEIRNPKSAPCPSIAFSDSLALPGAEPAFQPEGLVLAGGFVRHPVIPGVRLMRRLNAALPRWMMEGLLRIYARYARFRHRRAPETLDSIAEFMTNRLSAGDQEAIVHRLHLIASFDPRAVACQTRLPVHYLAGFVDPLVPFPFVRAWLRRHCPGYRGGRTIRNADHNVLATAPQSSARHILDWLGLKP